MKSSISTNSNAQCTMYQNESDEVNNDTHSTIDIIYNMEWLASSDKELLNKLEGSSLQSAKYLIQICKKQLKENKNDAKIMSDVKDLLFLVCSKYQDASYKEQDSMIYRKWAQALILITKNFDIPLYEVIIDTLNVAISLDDKDYKSRYKLAYILAKYASYMHADLTCDLKVIDNLFKESEENFVKSISIKSNIYKTHLLWGNALYEKLLIIRNLEHINDTFNLLTIKYFAAYTIEPHNTKTLKAWSKSLDFLIEYYLPYYWDHFEEMFKSCFNQFLAVIRDLMLHRRYKDFKIPLQYVAKYTMDPKFSFVNVTSMNLLNELKNKCKEEVVTEVENLISEINKKNEQRKLEFRKLKEKSFIALQSIPPGAYKIWKNSGLNVNDIFQYYDIFMNSLLFSVDRETGRHSVFKPFKRKSEINITMNKELEEIENDIIFSDPFNDFLEYHILTSGGSVYVGEDKNYKKFVIKKIKAEKGSKKYLRVLYEIYIMKKVKGPYVVEFYSAYYYDKAIYIIMEFCNGGTLYNLSTQLKLEEGEIAYFMYQICKGLHHIHINDIIHLDLKSENILIDIDTVKICDFGSARDVPYGEETLSSIVGTSHWIAPEIIKNKKYGQKADIWSLGCICLELIQGKRPNSNLSSLSCLFHTGTRGIPKFSWPTSIKWSRKIKNFVNEVLHPDPSRRPSAKELLQHPFFLNNTVDLDVLKCKIRNATINTSIKLSGLL